MNYIADYAAGDDDDRNDSTHTALVQPRPHAPLRFDTVRTPEPSPGYVLVKVAASAVNPFDYKILRHAILAQEWPWIGGTDLAGTVVEVGPGVESLKVDDRIIAATVSFLDGRSVAAWQEYAVVRSGLCTKIPDDLPFPSAASVPTGFVTASLAIALDLGLKYPSPPPPAQPKTAASIWAKALASISGGDPADYELELQHGTIQGGSWYPGGKTLYGFTSYGVHGIQAAPAPPKTIAPTSDPVQSREEQARRQALARELAEENGVDYDQLWAGPMPPLPRLTSADFPSASRPRSAPMTIGTGDMSKEAMDRRWGSGWDDPNGVRPIELVEDHITPSVRGLALIRGSVGSAGTSGSGSGSASTGMGRTSSGQSATSIEGMSMSLPCLPGGSASRGASASSGLSTRRGSGSLLGLDRGLASGSSSGLGLGGIGAVGGGARVTPHVVGAGTWGQLPVPSSGRAQAPLGGVQLPPLRRPSQSESTGQPTTGRSTPPATGRPTHPMPSIRSHPPNGYIHTLGSRRSTSPFRVPAIPSHRGRGCPPYTYHARERSPLEERSAVKEEEDAVKREAESVVKREVESEGTGRPSSLRPPGSLGDTAWVGRPSTAGSYPPLPSLYPPGQRPPPPLERRQMSELEASVYLGRPLTPPDPPAYVMDEPILVWGGGTCVGRNALQLLKKAGYTRLFVVAAEERHEELEQIVPEGTKFFDYRSSGVVAQIRAALGGRALKKVLDAVAMPYTLELVAQLVGPGATVAAVLPVKTPMPEGVRVKTTVFGRCHDHSGKDTLGSNFGRETMWPLLNELLRTGEYVFTPMLHLASATDAVEMMKRGENAGKRLVFTVPSSQGL